MHEYSLRLGGDVVQIPGFLVDKVSSRCPPKADAASCRTHSVVERLTITEDTRTAQNPIVWKRAVHSVP